MDDTVTSVWIRTSSTRSCRSISATSSGCCSDTHGLQHLLGVDRLDRLPRVEPGELALGGVLLRHAEETSAAELVGDRREPVEELGQRLARRPDDVSPEADELTR